MRELAPVAMFAVCPGVVVLTGECTVVEETVVPLVAAVLKVVPTHFFLLFSWDSVAVMTVVSLSVCVSVCVCEL